MANLPEGQRNGYTPREIARGFLQLDEGLKNLADSDFARETIEIIREILKQAVRPEITIDDRFINPFSGLKLNAGLGTMRQFQGVLVPQGQPVQRVPEFLAQQTRCPGLHLLVEFTDSDLNPTYLVGDNEIQKLFTKQTSPEDILPSEY